MVAIQQVSSYLKIRRTNRLLVPVKVCKSSKRPDMIAREQKTPRLQKRHPSMLCRLWAREHAACRDYAYCQVSYISGDAKPVEPFKLSLEREVRSNTVVVKDHTFYIKGRYESAIKILCTVWDYSKVYTVWLWWCQRSDFDERSSVLYFGTCMVHA